MPSWAPATASFRFLTAPSARAAAWEMPVSPWPTAGMAADAKAPSPSWVRAVRSPTAASDRAAASTDVRAWSSSARAASARSRAWEVAPDTRPRASRAPATAASASASLPAALSREAPTASWERS